MNYQIVPLTSAMNQTMQLNLTVNGAPLVVNLALQWSVPAGQWLLSISDAANNLMISMLPLVLGDYPAANILSQYGYLEIGSLWLLSLGEADDPNALNLSTKYLLLWGDNPQGVTA